MSQKGLCKSDPRRKPNVTGGSSSLNVYPMSGVLSAGWRFDWVGVLEHADSAWEELANFSRSEFFVLSIIIVSQPLTPLRRLLRLGERRQP